MSTALLVLLALEALFWLALVVLNQRLARTMDLLSEESAQMPEGRPWPKLSVLVPALNEEPHVERAMRSLLAQDYPALEVVAIDDRSTDRTGEILDRLAAEDPRLTVVHVRALPEGWLGKNHANFRGAERAKGDWLLFTDGDVVFAPDALRRSVAYAEAHALGHLVATPQLVAPDFVERAFVATFAMCANLKFQPWALRRARTRAFIGIGAFNLVRAQDYRAVGGHRTLALEVADDVKLGMILRRSGVAQGAVDSDGLVQVRWQAGLVASMRGLLKNFFSGLEWRWDRLLPAVLGLTLFAVLPALALLLGPAPVRLAALGTVSLAMAAHGHVAQRVCRGSGLESVVLLPCLLLLAGTLLSSGLLATLRDGIVWRGTRYPLDLLRKGCVREEAWPAERAVGWD